MGWIKKPIYTCEEIFKRIKAEFGETWNGRCGGSTTPCEYFSDHLRNYYYLTLAQCDEVCKMIKEYYGIDEFYLDDKKKPITRRICIIDHDKHIVYFEDISEKDLEKYNGSEQAFIDDTYCLPNYSWDYVVDCEFIDEETNPHTVDIKKNIITH